MEWSARPGRTSARYWRMGTFSLRQLSTMLKMAAIFGPASLLQPQIAILRQCDAGENRELYFGLCQRTEADQEKERADGR